LVTFFEEDFTAAGKDLEIEVAKLRIGKMNVTIANKVTTSLSQGYRLEPDVSPELGDDFAIDYQTLLAFCVEL